MPIKVEISRLVAHGEGLRLQQAFQLLHVVVAFHEGEVAAGVCFLLAEVVDLLEQFASFEDLLLLDAVFDESYHFDLAVPPPADLFTTVYGSQIFDVSLLFLQFYDRSRLFFLVIFLLSEVAFHAQGLLVFRALCWFLSGLHCHFFGELAERFEVEGEVLFLLLLRPPFAAQLKTDNLITGRRFLKKSLLASFPWPHPHSLGKVEAGIVGGGCEFGEFFGFAVGWVDGWGSGEGQTGYFGVVEDIGLLVGWTVLVFPVARGPRVDFVRVRGSFHLLLQLQARDQKMHDAGWDHCWLRLVLPRRDSGISEGELGVRSQTLTESIWKELHSPQLLHHCPLLSRNSEEALWELSLHGLEPTPSLKQPTVPPTARLRMRQKGRSKGAFLFLEYCQGLQRLVMPERSQQLWEEWSTVKMWLLSSSRQVQMILSSQYRPKVWKPSAKVPLVADFSLWVLVYWLVKQSAPQCMVEPKVSGPPPNSRGQPTFPLLSMMSISPLAGHSPYSLQRGRAQMAGQSQSPLGNLALTSTRPYWKVKELTVVSLPLMTGLMQWLPSLVRLQPQKKLPVHWSAGDPPHSSQVNPALTNCEPILSSVKTGLMLRMPSLAKVVVRLLSQIWNSQLPPPASVMSWRHLVKSRVSKSSWKTILPWARRARVARSSRILVFSMSSKIL